MKNTLALPGGRLQLESCPLAQLGAPTMAPTAAQLSTQRSGHASAGHSAAKEPPPAQPGHEAKPGSAPGTSPSPRTSAPGPRGQGRMPLPDHRVQLFGLPAQQAGASIPELSLPSFQPLDTNSRTRNLSMGEKCTSILTCSLHETSTTRVESHHCPLPHNPDTSRGDTSRPAAMQVHRQRDTLSQVVTHISLL